MPPNARAVREAVEALRSQGHNVVEWDFSTHTRNFMKLWPRVVFADKGEGLREVLADDTTDDAVSSLMTMLGTPQFFRRIITVIAKPFWPNLSMVMREMGGVNSVIDWWKLVEQVKNMRDEVVSDLKKNGLDAVVVAR